MRKKEREKRRDRRGGRTGQLYKESVMDLGIERKYQGSCGL